MAAMAPIGYMFSRDPGRFGGQQEDYILRSQAAVQTAKEQITNGVDEDKDLSKLFFEVLNTLAKTRQEIARDHGTKSAEIFGRRRDVDLGTKNMAFFSTCTHIDCEYTEYNSIFMSRLHKVMTEMSHNKHRFLQTNHSVKTKALERTSRYDVEVITSKELQKREWTKPFDVSEMKKALGIADDDDRFSKMEDFTNNKAIMERFKKENPNLYKRLKMSQFMIKVVKRYPSPKRTDIPWGGHVFEGNTNYLKSLYVLGTNRLEINGKLYALSLYLTWMYCNWEEDPVDRMKGRSILTIIHQDPFLIEPTLKEIAKIFAKAISWNREEHSVQELKNRVALLRYTFAHCMPFARGSAAIGEWLEASIYHYHGFDGFHHKTTTLGDLEAITALSLSDFLNRYDETIDFGK